MDTPTTQFERGSFAGHETFPFRYTWLRKAVQLTRDDGGAFRSEDAMVRLGVGKNMVRSIRHWALACGVIHEDPSVRDNRGRILCPTDFGDLLIGDGGWDEYFEDPATMWLLHWQLASAATPSTTWFWTFNHAPQLRFTKAELTRWMSNLVEQQGWSRVAESSLRRDVDCFVRTYVPVRPTRTVPLEDTLDCPLVDLGLIREQAKGVFQIMRSDHPSLPDELFAYSLATFVERQQNPARTLPLDVVAFSAGAPGRVFCLSEEALLKRLERLATITDGAMLFDETAGLRQVMVNKLPDPNDLLERCYKRAGRAA